MRIEQLVLYGPGDDDRVRFGPGVTVFAGLDAQERSDLIETLVDALTGRLSNASVVYIDGAGRKVYADRTGATFADTGDAAPAPHDILGHDPEAVTRLLTVTGPDLGLGGTVSVEDLRAQLAEARALLDHRRAERDELAERADGTRSWQAELASVVARIDRHDDDTARWAWMELRGRLDELQADLNLSDQAAQGRTDRQILDAVEALRSFGEAWTELAAQASTLRNDLGPLPAVSQASLDLVAATPPDLPPDFAARFDAWRSATDLHRAARAEATAATAPPATPDDALVVAFAELDQPMLWARHQALVEANEAYDQVASNGHRTGLGSETEEAIEAAHLDVVRGQREVERLFRTGLIAGGFLALAALVVAQVLHASVGGLLLVAAVASVAGCVVVPRRRLALAQLAEEQALSRADADSWLGLHLRRLDDVTDAAERKRFEAAAKARASAQVDWDEIAGAVSPDDLTHRTAAVRAYAEAINPKAIARRQDEARAFATAAGQAETAARAALTGGLEPYGFTADGSADLDPEQLADQLARRIRAGEVARRARRLATIERREADAGKRLTDLLRHLGFADGTLESRLERAIAAVASARQREQVGTRSKEDLAREIDHLVVELRATVRPTWAGTPEPSGPPVDRSILEARRRDLADLLSAADRPDVRGADERLAATETLVAELDARLDGMAGSRGSLTQQLISRMTRTTFLGGREETVPMLVDDALRDVPGPERLELLDVLERRNAGVQVVILSDDPVVASWARSRNGVADVTLYEAGPAPAPVVQGPLKLPASVTIF